MSALYFVPWPAFEERALHGECMSICRRICPSGLNQDFIRAAHNKSHRLCPQLADNTQSDCLLGHAASHSALHQGWIDPSLLVSPFTPTLTLWYPVYIYACVDSLFQSKIDMNVFLWRHVGKWKSSLIQQQKGWRHVLSFHLTKKWFHQNGYLSDESELFG